jgi:hypothetical protein
MTIVRLPPPTPENADRARKRHRREIKNASDARRRRGDFFHKWEVTKEIRAPLVARGHVLRREVDDSAVVRQALDDIVMEALHLKK